MTDPEPEPTPVTEDGEVMGVPPTPPIDDVQEPIAPAAPPMLIPPPLPG